MRASWGISCVAVALLLGGCSLDDLAYGGATTRAEKRVRVVFDAYSREGETTGVAFQTAVCTWWRDKTFINDSTELEWAYEEFRKFVAQGSLRKGFTYEIVSSEEIPDSEPPAVAVRGKINGSAFELVVPEKKPFSWKKAPPPY